MFDTQAIRNGDFRAFDATVNQLLFKPVPSIIPILESLHTLPIEKAWVNRAVFTVLSNLWSRNQANRLPETELPKVSNPATVNLTAWGQLSFLARFILLADHPTPENPLGVHKQAFLAELSSKNLEELIWRYLLNTSLDTRHFPLMLAQLKLQKTPETLLSFYNRLFRSRFQNILTEPALHKKSDALFEIFLTLGASKQAIELELSNYLLTK
jgi:hypothetical protein